MRQNSLSRYRQIRPGDLHDFAKGSIGIWSGEVESETVPHLVIEEVFWKVKGQGEYRKQEPPHPDCRVTSGVCG